MPFLDEINDVRENVPAGRLPRPVLAGIALVAVAIVVLAALGVASSARGDFVVDDSASSSSAAIAKDGNQAGSAARMAQTVSAGSETAVNAEAGTCLVYVVGAVKEPGVYELKSDARVNDAVSAAGGLTKKADASAVNLARVVVDGEQITIPEEGEAKPAELAASSASGPSRGGAVAGISDDGKVNVNTATASELESLPGIGEVTAQKIIASRESEGPFTSVEDLKRVSGIGEKKLAAIADLVTI